jgi:hypothetical protein
MVYSQTKRTASISSITNQNQGGGSKKAGFPYLVGRESWTSVALNKKAQFLSKAREGLQFTMKPNVRQSRPISMTPSAGRSYFN